MAQPVGGTLNSSSGASGAAPSNGGVAGTESVAGSGGTSTAGTAGSGGTQGGAAGAGGTGPCAECAALRAALAHRYDFEGSGSVVTDRVGTAHGAVVGGATLSSSGGKGVVVLNGGTTGSYVDLPNGIVSSLASATFEAWLTWTGGDAWQRIFDFGDSNAASPEDAPADGKSYLFVTPMTDANSGGLLRAVYSLDGGAAAAETRVDAAGALPVGLAQVVVVIDATAGQLLLYRDGEQAGEQPFTLALASINDVNCWLGRSQYDADPELDGTFHDFRIYDAALTPAQIAASFAGGPDPAFLAQ
jgi:hypothetical protein